MEVKMKTRQRNKTLSIRLSGNEKELLIRKAKQHGKSITEYILSTVLYGSDVDHVYLIEMLKALRKASDKLDLIENTVSQNKDLTTLFHEILDKQKEINNQIIKFSADFYRR